MNFNQIITIVIPCYKVSSSILSVVKSIDSNIQNIIIVDDCCPERSGYLVFDTIKDNRISLIFHDKNMGVGAAVKSGYARAMELNSDIVIKIDGDGQMDINLILDLIRPILAWESDYTKGNRFFSPEYLKEMPVIRLIGNGILSFINKLVSGYWTIMDPTNGFTAIHINALRSLNLEKIDDRYFFENDILFRLNIIRAKVTDIPMIALYGNEKSNLSVYKTILQFPFKYINRFFKRVLYNYFIRDFNIASLEILFGSILFNFGVLYGGYHWIYSEYRSVDTPIGTIVLSSTSLLIGFQLLLSALNYDIQNIPSEPLCRYNILKDSKKK